MDPKISGGEIASDPTPRVFANFVAGAWQTGTGETMRCLSPGTGEKIAEVPVATPEEAAVAAAAAAAAAERFRELAPIDRSRLCHRVADALDEREAELARWLSRDQGKPYTREALLEARSCASFFRQAAEDILRLDGQVFSSNSNTKRIFTTYRGRGPHVVITPWNFPYNIAAEHLSAHLAAGNTVVWVPSPEVAACSLIFAEALIEADMPDGVFNVLTGLGHVVGDALVTDPAIVGISLTGSSTTGDIVMHRAGAKPALLELGGNGPVIVLSDADLHAAARGIVFSAYFNAGQACSATERVLVTRDVHDELVELVLEETRTVVLGQPFEDATTMGPLNNEGVAHKMDAHLADAVDRGAVVLAGGERDKGLPTPLYYRPTVIDNVPTDALVNREETFGPVVPVILVEGPDEALALANQDATGLVASLYTKDLSRAMTLARRLRAGVVNVNETPDYWELHVPYGGGGGTKSGYGRLGGRHALRTVMDLQTTILEVGS